MPTIYLVLKFIHVLLAITALGANITYGVWLARAARQPQHLEYVLRGVKLLDDRLANPAYALVLVTGLAMLYVGRIPWTTPWVLTSLVLYAVIVIVGLSVYAPVVRRQIEALARVGRDSAAYRMAEARGRTLGILTAVLVISIVFLMVTKPPLWR